MSADSDPPIETFGLTHVALSVAAPGRSFRFYQLLLGARLLGSLEGREDDDLSDEDWIEFGTPGSHDVIVLTRANDEVTGDTGQLAHFGFRTRVAEDPDVLAKAVESAGGTVGSKGRWDGGGTYVFAKDPDGYVIELWSETDPAWRSDASD